MQKRLFGILASLAIVAAACGGATTSPEPAVTASPAPGATAAPTAAPPESNLADEQIYRIDISGEPPTLDPTMAQDSQSLAVLRGLHRPLVYIDKDLKVVPALAESWVISPDAQTFTFTLRDAQYSNGDPIVAGDLVYSFKRLVDPRLAAPYSYVMAEIEGGPELLGMTGADPAPSDADVDAALDAFGVEAPDDKTFIIHLNTPATYFLSALTLWVAVPIQESWITSEGATEAENYVSSGPYMLGTWNHNSEIILVPNPNWYGDVKPTLTEIHMSMSPEPAQAQAAYEAGELDSYLPVDTVDVPRVKDDPVLSLEYQELSQLSTVYYDFNNGVDASGEGLVPRCQDAKACPTANKNFRIALTEAIDKEAFKNATYAGIGQIANSFVMPGIPGYDETINPYPFNLDSAKAHMATALQELGFASAAEIPPLKFGFNTGAGHEPRVAFMAEAWRQAFGLETEQIGTDFSVLLTQRRAGDYDIARDRWGADYPHANNQLNGLHTCGGGNNNANYCNPAFDKLIQQAAREPDQAKQEDLYKEAQRILMDDAPFIPLLYVPNPSLVKPYVSGVIPTPMDSHSNGEHFYETIQILKH
jgi:oligopeptide transport system substrate-binding protein